MILNNYSKVTELHSQPKEEKLRTDELISPINDREDTENASLLPPQNKTTASAPQKKNAVFDSRF